MAIKPNPIYYKGKFLHNHPQMEKTGLSDKSHVIVDRGVILWLIFLSLRTFQKVLSVLIKSFCPTGYRLTCMAIIVFYFPSLYSLIDQIIIFDNFFWSLQQSDYFFL